MNVVLSVRRSITHIVKTVVNILRLVMEGMNKRFKGEGMELKIIDNSIRMRYQDVYFLFNFNFAHSNLLVSALPPTDQKADSELEGK